MEYNYNVFFSKSMSVSVSIAKYLSSAGAVNSCFFMVPLCCRSNKGNVAESAERERERESTGGGGSCRRDNESHWHCGFFTHLVGIVP